MSTDFETSKKEGSHFQLGRLVGEWTGTSRVWFEPDVVADESPVTGTIRPILGGRFALHEYKGSFGGKPLEGIAIYGYHTGLKRWQSAWVDSFHNDTAIMFSEGKRGDEALSMLGSYTYVTPEMEQVWGWRTEIDIVSDQEIKITAYNVTPQGDETKATETIYRRI